MTIFNDMYIYIYMIFPYMFYLPIDQQLGDVSSTALLARSPGSQGDRCDAVHLGLLALNG